MLVQFCLCVFFTPGFEKDVPSVGDGKVEEMYKAIAISWQSLAFVCSPACRKLARYVKGIVECISLARFSKKKKKIVQDLTSFASGER